jgi:hypothetical protein
MFSFLRRLRFAYLRGYGDPVLSGILAFGNGSEGVREWFEGCPGMVRGASGNGSKGVREWFEGRPGMVRRASGNGSKGVREWFEGCPGMVRRVSGNGSKGVREWFERRSKGIETFIRKSKERKT